MPDPVLKAREKEAKMKSDWYACRSDTHPHGKSGHRLIIPKELSSDCRDTSKRSYGMSEWGNLAGFPDA